MIDKILQTFSTTLGDIVYPESTSSIPTINPKLPPTDKYLKIGEIDFPLYSGMLAGEMRLLEKLLELQNSIQKGVTSLTKLIGADEYTPLSDIRRALRTGGFQTYKNTVVKVAWTKIGQPELAKIAATQGVDFFTSTVGPDGDRSVQDVIDQFYPAWIETGYSPDPGLKLANAVLNKQPLITRELADFISFDPEEVLQQSGLTWEEIDLIEDLVNQDIGYLLIIKFRLGIGQYNILDYLPYAEKIQLIDSLKAELSGQPVLNANVASNDAVETENSEGGGGQENLT